ncbi:MAG: hypothetical protein RL398_1563 [Planctomycetota bacterium]|jgi:hypothetical protein
MVLLALDSKATQHMNPRLSFVLAVAAAASALTAQSTLPPSSSLPRGEVRLTDNYINVNTHGWGTWRMAAPAQVLQAGPVGTVPTAQVAYVSYMDSDGSGTYLRVRRSKNGGFSWEAPINVHTLSPGEVLSSAETRLVAFEHEIYLVFASNLHNLSSTLAQSVWAVGSNDQGQTWTQPALLSTGMLVNLYDADEVNAAVSQLVPGTPGCLNVVYEADYASPASGIEDIFHVQAQIVGGSLTITAPETRLNYAASATTHDVNFTDIVAQGPVVHVCWTDNRSLGGTNQYDYFSMTSRQNGTDFATTVERRHTQHVAPISWAAPRRPHGAIDLPHVYTFMEYARTGKDDVFMDWSLDLGMTWSHTGIAINTATLGSLGDIDDFVVTASGGRVAVAYVDDRLNGTNNNDNNQAICSVSYNAGFDFVNATHVEVPLSQRDPNPIYDIAMVGDKVAVLYETNCIGAEDFAISMSGDGGRTFTHYDVTQLGQCATYANTTDVDDPRFCMTQNGDCLAVWIDDRGPIGNGLGNASNHVWATGIHYPELVDRTATQQGLRFQNDSPAAVGDLALVLISGSGTNPTSLNLDGFTMNFQFDFWTQAAIGGAFALPPGFPNLNLDVVGANGAVDFPGIPNVAQLVGLPFWAAALTISPVRGFSQFTDPIRFQ